MCGPGIGLAFVLCASPHAARAQTPANPVTWNETRVTDDPADQFESVVANGTVVWMDFRDPAAAHLRVRNLATGDERPLTSAPVQPFAPDLYGNHLAYGAMDASDPNSADIFTVDVATDETTPVATDPGFRDTPAVSEEWVVWREGPPAYRIQGRRLTGGPIETFASGTATILRPRISGNQVVFDQNAAGAGNWNAFGYDIATTETYPVAVGPGHQQQADIDETRVVYLGFRSQDLNGDADVFLFDIATGVTTPLTTTPAPRRRPRISGQTVVWYEGTAADGDVRGYDLLTGTELPLAVGPTSALLPDIDGHDVVFSDDRNGAWDIYHLTLNRAPQANAGPDQEVTAVSPQGASVTLEGSASSDGDGDPLTFTWTGPFGTLSGPVVTAPLAVGTWQVTLTVADAWGGSSSDTVTVVVRAMAGCPQLYVETFDPHGIDADPVGWVDFGPSRQGPVEAEGFRTASFDGRVVYEARRNRRASEYRSAEALAWRNYEWTGAYRPPLRAQPRDGFLLYSDLAAGSYYLLAFGVGDPGPPGYTLVKSDGGALVGMAASPFGPRPGTWNTFRLRIVTEPDATHIRARFWESGQPEPSDWTIDARDSVEPLRSGTIGVATLARGLRHDDFRVQALAGPLSGISGDRDHDGVCDLDDPHPDEPGRSAFP